MALSDVADAYNRSGATWRRGPGRVYDRLAEVLVDACPIGLAGALVLDLGAGTGAVGRAAKRRRAETIAVDISIGMLSTGAVTRPTAVVGDALALPFAAHSFDAVVAAFSLNHLTKPATGLREAARVLRPGGGLVVGAYAADDTHPAREATESAARAHGWVQPPWYVSVRRSAVPLLATVERATEVARAAGLTEIVVTNERVPFSELALDELVAWRMGMAHLAPFVATLAAHDRAAMSADAVARLAGAPPLVRSVIVVSHRAAG